MAFSRIIGTGTLEALVAGVDRWRKGNMEKCRLGLNACAFNRYEIGGSRETPLGSTAVTECWESRPFWVPDYNAWYTGFVYILYIELKVLTGNTVRAFLKDDLGTTVWTSADSTSTTWAQQSVTFTPTIGRTYILYLQKDDTDLDAWGIGYVIQLARAL